ncbi:MAG: isoprenoid biosynthesis glyoxalase ElbB [bacterium]|nr:isoprenoid biosynthesis glyoxalase ElbB [bacterium]
MAKKVGVILAGCGYLDGAEIQEAILTMLYLDREGAEIVAMAPDKPQAHVINHLTGKEMIGETRNILVESARIARGKISTVDPNIAATIDALILPGGFGVAKNICTYAFDGVNCSVDENVANLIQRMHQLKKPIGAICISPVVLAKVLGKENVSPILTIGTDPNTAKDIEKLKGKHLNCSVSDYVIDRENKLVSTPAWMLGPKISDIAKGIEKLVLEILSMC